MSSQEVESKEQGEKKSKTMLWLKRIGFWGFMFFLVKGLIWVAIIAGAAKSC